MTLTSRILRIAIEDDRSYVVLATCGEYRYIVQAITASGNVIRDVYDTTGNLKRVIELFDLRFT